MKFSDAVVLGSSLRKFGKAALYEDGQACALGLAGIGGGVITEPVELGVPGGLVAYREQYVAIRQAFALSYAEQDKIIDAWDCGVMGCGGSPQTMSFEQFVEWAKKFDREPPVQEPTQVEVRQESTVSHD